MKDTLKTTILVRLIFVVASLASSSGIKGVFADDIKMSDSNSAAHETYEEVIFLPVVLYKEEGIMTPGSRINLPYFEALDLADKYSELAIAWFGKVNLVDNYADIRTGYNNEGLYVSLNIFDRILWYDTDPSPNDLTNWDAVTLYFDLDSNLETNPDINSYQFIAALNHWEPREDYQAAYRGNGTTWEPAAIPFVTTTYYRGEGGFNNDEENRGWGVHFNIPFASLGLSNPPPVGSLWKFGAMLHDRDDSTGSHIERQTWPKEVDGSNLSNWGELRFGLVSYVPPSANPSGEVTIRNKLDGVTVPDAAVGGTTGNLCPGDSYHIWNVWGFANYAYAEAFNIQNQADIADWPCFAKYYITFPLSSLPREKQIISANLVIYQFGNSGDLTDPDPRNRPRPSLIQALTVAEEWDEQIISWNNAPLALENVSQAWVSPLAEFPPWPGVAREWDVSYAVAQAYAAGQSLSLVLYDADAARHSGKYFSSSDTGDWNEIGRPALVVIWGEP